MSPLAPADRAAAAWPSIGGDPADNLARLDQMPWVYRSSRLRALDFDFAVRTSNGTVGRFLGDLLRAFEVPGEPSHIYSFIDREQTPDGRYQVYRDGEVVSITTSPSSVLRHLFWDVNRNVVEGTRDLLLLHASAVERAGRAAVFPAPMGSGKTTLVTGLLQRGARYVTDEAVALDPSDLKIRPYAKPLSIESGSWDVLSDLRPRVDASLEPFLEAGWYVPPDAIHDDAVASPCAPRLVISPRYERGARTELVQILRSEALVTLAENCFNITNFGPRRSMEILARVVRSSRCYRLTVGDLGQACDAVLELMDASNEDDDGVDR
jgi:hypothetical protein